MKPRSAIFSKSLPVPFWLGILTLLAINGYLQASAAYYRRGFPLDDAWIHQTYARNLALYGQWAFIPGQPSAGSTSPLWTILLAPGHWLANPPYFWTYLLGGLALFGLGWSAEAFFRRQSGSKSIFPIIGALLILEWHMVWAAASGMETILFALCAAGMLALLSAPSPRWFWAGLLAGSSLWVRPEGLTLLGPLLFSAVLLDTNTRQRLLNCGLTLAGFAALCLPYLAFNWLLAGTPWPNTFYAKQAEYAVQLQQPFLARLVAILQLPLVGVGALLLPGFLYRSVQAVRQRQIVILAAVLWWLGTSLIYVFRFAVTYQHGRYLIPSMPVFFVVGCLGTAQLLYHCRQAPQRIWALVGRAWVISIATVSLAFYALAAFQYAQDVAIIETEMVATAQWVAREVPPQAIVAAHDIGALGYYGDHRLIDLAGLISPEVVPFIRDERRLADYLDAQNAAYLVTFPGWYSTLPAGKEILFRSQGKYAPEQGGENMYVYRWR